MVKNIILSIILLLCCLGCADQEEPTPLPEQVVIDISNKNLSEKTVGLVATHTTGTQYGEWAVLSENMTVGSFESTSSPVTKFTGSILEPYQIRWTINNGEETIHSDFNFIICEGENLEDVIQYEMHILKLVKLTFIDIYTLEDLNNVGINAWDVLQNITLDELLEYYTVEELMDFGVNYRHLLDSFTLQELVDMFPIENMIISNDNTNLYHAYITTQEFLDAGFTLEFLWNNLVETPKLEVLLRDTTIDNLLSAGINLVDIWDQVKNMDDFYLELFFEQVDIDTLLNDNIDIEDLYTHGVSLQQLIDSSLTIKDIDLALSSITLVDLLQQNVPYQTLLDEHLVIGTPQSGFFILNTYTQLDESAILDVMNDLYAFNSTWRLPTLDELNYIYNHNETINLDTDFSQNMDVYFQAADLYYDSSFCDLDLGGHKYLNFTTGEVDGCCWVIDNSIPPPEFGYLYNCDLNYYILPVIQF